MDTVVARTRLEEIRDELDRSIAVREGSGPQRPADAGASLTESQRSAAMLTAARQQRSEVLGALRRIEEGSYGVCADCGAKVPEGRMEARPDAARCVSCQGKRDRLRR